MSANCPVRGRGTLQGFFIGRLCPSVQHLTRLYTIWTEKLPFSHTYLRTLYSFPLITILGVKVMDNNKERTSSTVLPARSHRVQLFKNNILIKGPFKYLKPKKVPP